MNDNETLSASKPQTPSLIGVELLLKKSWQIYKERIKTLIGISVIPMVVALVFGFIATSSGVFLAIISLVSKNPLFLLSFIFVVVVLVVASVLIGLWGELALIYAIKERAQKIGIIESFKKVTNKIISSLWISVLVGAAVVIGFFLFVIPAIIFAVWFFAATYVLVAEGIRGTKALSKSKQLVKGNWLAVFWRLVVIVVLAIGVGYIAESFSKAIGISFLANIITLFITPFPAIYSFLIYENLKELKDKTLLKS